MKPTKAIAEFREGFSTGSTDEHGVFHPDKESERREKFFATALQQAYRQGRDDREKELLDAMDAVEWDKLRAARHAGEG